MRLKISEVRGELGVAHSTFHVITLSDIAWRSFAYALERRVNSLTPICATAGYRLADLPLRRCYRSRVSLKVKVLHFVKSGVSEGTRTPDLNTAGVVLSRASRQSYTANRCARLYTSSSMEG